MSDLPDLNTDNISFIAYWNAIDDGGTTTIDPEDALTDSNINEYTLYDNGVHIDSYNGPNGREMEARVKTDGWMVAYLDRTEKFATETTVESVRGWWDIANGWSAQDSSPSDFTNHSLAAVIGNLVNELSNSDNVSYSPSDVGLYNYEYPDATTTTGMSTIAGSPSFSFTADTTIHAAVAFGSKGSGGGNIIEFEGNMIVGVGTAGSIDIKDILTDSGKTYSGDAAYTCELDVMILWS